MKFLAIIPARYASSRFPGKPLAKIGKKTMLQRVCEQAALVFDYVTVATDDKRILEAAIAFGVDAVMTDKNHKSGTDRCKEALDIFEKKSKLKFDIVINIQGDEPFIQPEQLQEIKMCFKNKNTQIATLIKKIDAENEIFNPNKPKVVIRLNGDAIYFSRSPIPYVRNTEKGYWHKAHSFFKHIGMYGYRCDILREITQLPASSVELAEQLEQNRWLENGFNIQTAITTFESDSVDTPEDLAFVIQKYL